jgi:glycosyltransferase involved in cell wall biosynthesis
MKILALCSGYLLSGKEFVTLNTIRGFQHYGHYCKIFFSGWNDGKFAEKLREMNADHEPLKLGWYYLTKISWSLDSLWHYPGAVKKVLRAQKKIRPGIIYTDSFRPVILLYPFLKGKIVFHVNDPHAFSALNRFLMRVANRKISLYLAASSFIKKDIIACGVNEHKIMVVHNGVPMPAEAVKEYMPAKKIRIGIAGQVLPRKGHEDVVEACSLLRGKIPFELKIFGSGAKDFIQQLKNAVKEKNIEDDVEWMGFQSDKKEIYDSLDVLLAPTRNEEPFALVALEASGYRVPVIASKSGGFYESVVDEKTGFLVNKNSPAEIAAKLTWLYNNPQQLMQMGNNAREYATTNFSIEKMNEKIEQIFSELCPGKEIL